MTLIATRISDRCIDVDTPSGPLRITRDALSANPVPTWRP
jgi:hypothetical protein